MATEDVLARANDHAMVYAHFHSASSDYHQVTFNLIAALAAEVRGLRRDKARLDWLQKEKPTITRAAPSLRAAIDAAMGGEGGLGDGE